ncbi:sigma-54-dependent transcriptional regulator [Desulforegula conservatrix]|uniref:sigma-54-dependent transcriptional regulator n=1 Tax=Desulforegula conservatrix TaxID=153026 RepID=UPI0003F8F77D|nr:sigma-54 dependent transcriptional regulator [Desulforegula conservatrix]
MKKRILIVDDESRYLELYRQVIEAAGFTTTLASSAEEALSLMDEKPHDMIVSDVRMTGASGIELLQKVRGKHELLPFLLVTAYADVRDAVKAMKLGAVDYLSKPVDLDELISAINDTLGVSRQFQECEIPSEALRGIVAESPAMRSVLRDAFRVAASDSNVLLTGESGSGKEIVAEFIHRNSQRRNRPMIAVNCAAIPANLLASELFGHEKGAFTGAVARRTGRFREADGSTLFLDEIGDMTVELQPTLLRAIETGVVNPVGSDKETKTDFRLLAATNQNLQTQMESGKFRQDLYYRLNVIAIEIPPLRERQEDILPLARFFIAQGHSEIKRLSRATASALIAYHWPGNVRELANSMEHALLLCQSDVISPDNLPPVIRRTTKIDAITQNQSSQSECQNVKTLEEREIESIKQVLLKTGGNRTQAAELLGITRRGLIYKMKRLGVM